jgi:hypothetical protein
MLDGPSLLPGNEDIAVLDDKNEEEDDESQAAEGDQSDYDVRLARKPGE